MKTIRESLAPLVALACAATVFLATALESPEAVSSVAVPALKAR